MRKRKRKGNGSMATTYTLILAPNASLMTGPGTNTIVLGGGEEGALVIDPADDNPAHLKAIVRAGNNRGGIRRILITHGHPDHLGGAETLRAQLGVPIYAFSRAGTPIVDQEVPDGALFPLDGATLRALHTPGHRFDHLCFLLESEHTLFAGDLVSGITTNVIIPPEGDMLAYLNSLKLLQSIDIAKIVPGHGPEVLDAQERLAEYIAHRLQREQQVINALHTLPPGATIPTIVEHIYVDVDPRLHPVAAWTVEAHLLKLERENSVRHNEKNGWELVKK
jgi:glyoxylase-like metal-dependent hydrolase (beta-lactamase superfamily II)